MFDGRKKVSLRFNSNDGKSKIFDVDLQTPENNTTWLVHLTLREASKFGVFLFICEIKKR